MLGCATQAGTGPPGAAVLYWMRTAARAEENPALDVARAAAAARRAPLVVAAVLLTGHPYPTARRWQFWLEGLRDVQRDLRQQVARPCARLARSAWASGCSMAAMRARMRGTLTPSSQMVDSESLLLLPASMPQGRTKCMQA